MKKRYRRVTTIMVLGDPKPKGSTTSIPYHAKDTGKLKVRTFSASKAGIVFERLVKYDAVESWRRNVGVDAPPLEGAVRLNLKVKLARPKSASVKKRPFPIVKPDLDKLERLVLDAFTGVVYLDDAQVTKVDKEKEYAEGAEKSGVYVEVFEALPAE